METYREKLKLQNVVFAIGCVALALFSVLGFLGEAGVVKLAPSVGDGHWQSRWRGFISGASFGILVLLLTGLIRNLRALKDEKKLKKLYIKESDERQAQIVAKALCEAMRATLILGLAGGYRGGVFQHDRQPYAAGNSLIGQSDDPGVQAVFRQKILRQWENPALTCFGSSDRGSQSTFLNRMVPA